MIAKPWTAEERARILRDLAELHKQRDQVLEREDWDLGDVLMAKIDQLNAAYNEGLPRVVMSCCPICGRSLVRTFDPMGFDGLWWRSDYPTEEVPSCPHFCVLSGAVTYQGLPPRAGSQEVSPGPEVPFVYPRLLGLPGVVAVISALPMENGYLAYSIGYFADKRPPGEQLVAGWRGKVHYWKDQLGGSGWRIENDQWDFDLRPWLEQGKIRWTAPGSDRTKLADEPWDRCPYSDLPGQHKAVVVYDERHHYENPPDGSYVSPYED
jgi:hypothetical protein